MGCRTPAGWNCHERRLSRRRNWENDELTEAPGNRVKGAGMLFNSPIFLFGFLPVTVALYLVVRQTLGPRAVLGLLLCASIFFYGWWNPAYVPLLLGLALFNFVVARGITAFRMAGRADRVTLVLTFGIVGDLI